MVQRKPPSPRTRVRLSEWPVIDERVLEGPRRAIYRGRVKAIEAYARGDKLDAVETTSGVHRATVLRLIQRAHRAHADGRLWGFRALVPHARVASYERLSAPKVLVHTRAGNAGAFSQLLLRHPALEAQLRSELKEGRVTLRPGGERGRLGGVAAAAQRFQQACRRLGLGAGDYPLNQSDKAVRSLARTLHSWLEKDFDLAARAAGTRIKPASALRHLPERGASDAFDTVEFDPHKMDVRLKVIDRDPTGIEHSYEIERVWLLAIIDVPTRCILGYTLSLQRECSRFDVIDTFRRAITPAVTPVLTLPGLRLLPSGGLVSQALPTTAHACWWQIRLDNARAHQAATSLDVLCDALGCTADFGPAYQPDDRPFIERFFGTVTSALSRRLPGAIHDKRSSQALLKRLRDPADDLRLIVTVPELEELLAVTVWNYHGSPHAGLGGLAPLEMMRRHVLGIGREPVRLRHVPQPLRERPMLLQDPVACRVHGNLARGERPYVSFLHVRYTSTELARRSALIGTRLRIHVDPADLRQLTACTEDGQIMEPLLASGPWRHEPHSLRLRQLVFKAKRARELTFGPGDNPIEAFLSLRRKQAPKKRRAASDIAQVQRERRAERKAAMPASTASTTATSDDTLAPSSTPGSQLATGPVKGQALSIRRGFAR